MKTQMYYKVVTIGLKSAIDIARDLGLETQYVVGQWVKPRIKQAPLMVFNDLERAQSFIRANDFNGPYRLFKCEIKPSKRKWGWLSTWMKDDFFSALKHRKRWSDLVDYDRFPLGTVFADEVMLVEEIL